MKLVDAMRIEGLRKENARAWAENERLRAALINLKGVFKRERLEDMCSLYDDNKTVTEIANAALGNQQQASHDKK